MAIAAVEPFPEPHDPTPVSSSQELVRLSQDDFVNEVFAPHYEPGQHVAIMGPTRSGKTTIAYKLLNEIASPKLPAVILVMKPKDDTVKDWSKLAGFRKTETWPPIINRALTKRQGGLGKRQRGWVFWPRHSLTDIDRDNKMLSRQFSLALAECYRKGNRIVFADEVVGLAKELGLDTELNAIWARGGGMGCGLWAATQRPFHAPLLMYGSSEHILIFKDADKRSRERYDEIGGVDGKIVEETVMRLRKHEFLYIGRYMAADEVTPGLAIINAD